MHGGNPAGRIRPKVFAGPRWSNSAKLFGLIMYQEKNRSTGLQQLCQQCHQFHCYNLLVNKCVKYRLKCKHQFPKFTILKHEIEITGFVCSGIFLHCCGFCTDVLCWSTPSAGLSTQLFSSTHLNSSFFSAISHTVLWLSTIWFLFVIWPGLSWKSDAALTE